MPRYRVTATVTYVFDSESEDADEALMDLDTAAHWTDESHDLVEVLVGREWVSPDDLPIIRDAYCEWCFDKMAAEDGTEVVSLAGGSATICPRCLHNRNGGGECDWCEATVEFFDVIGTAGARCRECADRPLCGWCGEAPAHEDTERCEDCLANDESDY